MEWRVRLQHESKWANNNAVDYLAKSGLSCVPNFVLIAEATPDDLERFVLNDIG